MTSYIYSVRDQNGAELVAYHWHPAGGSRVGWPHLHVSDPLLSSESKLQKTHLPTGEIQFEHVLRALITEFGVSPRRTDWEHVIERNRR